MKKKSVYFIILGVLLFILIFLYINRGAYTEEDIHNIAYEKLSIFLEIYNKENIDFYDIEEITGLPTSYSYFTLDGLPQDKIGYEILETELRSEGDSSTLLVFYAKVVIYTKNMKELFDFELSLYSPGFTINSITKEIINNPFNWRISWKRLK